MKKNNGFYVGVLYDVGCDVLAVGQTKDEVVSALMNVYDDLFEDFNGVSAKESDTAYYDEVLEIAEKSVQFHKFGSAWTFMI